MISTKSVLVEEKPPLTVRFKIVREKLGLSEEAFAERFDIPLEQLQKLKSLELILPNHHHIRLLISMIEADPERAALIAIQARAARVAKALLDQTKAKQTLALSDVNELLFQLNPNHAPANLEDFLKVLKEEYAVLHYESGLIVGMAFLVKERTITGLNGIVHHVVVDRDYRRRGIGKKIVSTIISIAKCQRMRRLSLNSGDDLPGAHRLYEGLGFRKHETNVFRLQL